ncbi:MAG: hypothetical protein NXH72_04415 [Hyphomonadaceae bacterium]|nr:hypothetical protein [Hyphomonadaceae bacterium]
MKVAEKLPVEYVDPNNEDGKPVVTLIGADISEAYLDDAEPSPTMEALSRFWQRIIGLFKLGLVLILVGGYPALVVMNHKVDSSAVVLSSAAPWYSNDTGTAMTLLGRELTVAGWAADRSWWHPQARLTALPAWQDGITGALSDYTLLASEHAAREPGAPDSDLLAAARLLVPSQEAEATPRLNAAAEALQSYEGRLSRGLAAQPKGLGVLLDELALYKRWASDSETRLRSSANRAEAWPASREDIEALYSTRAYAQVASQLIMSSLIQEPELVQTRDAREARDQAIFAWRRAATFNPIMVSSQAGTGSILSDHPAAMMYYLSEIQATTTAFIDALQAQEAEMVAVAESGTAE